MRKLQPRKAMNRNVTSLSFTIDNDVVEMLEEVAVAMKKNRSRVINMLIRKAHAYVQERKNER